jgi:hypothetical protein
VPLAFPLAPDVTVIQGALLTAVHGQPDATVTVMLPVDAPAGADVLVGEIPNVQGAPACETVKVWPAIVIDPLRGAVVGLAATE